MRSIFSLRGHWARSGDIFGGVTGAREWGYHWHLVGQVTDALNILL